MRLSYLSIVVAPLGIAVAQVASPARINPVTASVDTLLGTPGPTWLSARSAHFTVYLERSMRGTSPTAMVDTLESAWRRAIDLLGGAAPDGQQATVFVTASRTRFSGLAAPEARGLTTRLQHAGEIVVLVRNDSVRAYVQHEIMHVASYAVWGPANPKLAWLAEGLATFADGRCQNSTIQGVGRDLLAAHPEITARLILDHFVESWQTDRAAAYVLAGTFVDYLWSSRGRDGVRRIWLRLDSLVDVGVFPGAGGQLTAGWREYVGRAAGATPGIDLNSLQRAGCG